MGMDGGAEYVMGLRSPTAKCQLLPFRTMAFIRKSIQMISIKSICYNLILFGDSFLFNSMEKEWKQKQ